jgi:hypothetical protein
MKNSVFWYVTQCGKVDLGYVPKVFREPIRGFHDLLRQKTTLSIDIVMVEFSLNGFPNNAVHMSGFRGEDGRIVELNSVSLVDTVFSYSQLVRVF